MLGKINLCAQKFWVLAFFVCWWKWNTGAETLTKEMIKSQDFTSWGSYTLCIVEHEKLSVQKSMFYILTVQFYRILKETGLLKCIHICIYIYCVVYIEICSALPDELSIYLYLATQVVYIISTYMHMGYSFLYGAHMQVNCSRVEWIIGNIFCFCWLHSEAWRPSRIVLDVRAGRLFLFLHLSLLVKNEEPEWCVSGIQMILSAVQSIFRRALISVLRKELDEKKRFLSNSHSNSQMFWK